MSFLFLVVVNGTATADAVRKLPDIWGVSSCVGSAQQVLAAVLTVAVSVGTLLQQHHTPQCLLILADDIYVTVVVMSFLSLVVVGQPQQTLCTSCLIFGE